MCTPTVPVGRDGIELEYRIAVTPEGNAWPLPIRPRSEKYDPNTARGQRHSMLAPKSFSSAIPATAAGGTLEAFLTVGAAAAMPLPLC